MPQLGRQPSVPEQRGVDGYSHEQHFSSEHASQAGRLEYSLVWCPSGCCPPGRWCSSIRRSRSVGPVVAPPPRPCRTLSGSLSRRGPMRQKRVHKGSFVISLQICSLLLLLSTKCVKKKEHIKLFPGNNLYFVGLGCL